jgi:hypothetical protein
MQSSLVGIYWLLNQLPIWVTVFILLTLCINILFPGRGKFEGLAYNISYASQLGDAALIICILIGATVLQREQFVPERMWEVSSQVFIGVESLLAGMLCTG